MKITIQEIKDHPNTNELVIITAIVYRPHYLPEPKTDSEHGNVFTETNQQYQERIKPAVIELNKFNNLHIGDAELNQELNILKPPKMEEYWS